GCDQGPDIVKVQPIENPTTYPNFPQVMRSLPRRLIAALMRGWMWHVIEIDLQLASVILSRPDKTCSMESRFNRRELLVGILYAFVLLWVNAYVCRELFVVPTARTNSMHGFWMALARLGGTSWLHPTWWPYWDCGMPFEFTYQPLIPILTAGVTRLRGVFYQLGFQTVSALVYILLPATLFLMAWRLTRAPGYAFFAGLAYSLLSPSHLLTPDGSFRLANIADP